MEALSRLTCWVFRMFFYWTKPENLIPFYVFSRSHDRNCFLGFIFASWHNSCNLLVKSWAALISCYTELRASLRLALVQPPRLSDWCVSWSRTLCGCYRLAQRKPGSRSALNCTHTFHFSAPSTPKPQAEHPTMGGLLPRCPPHLVGAATCQMLFLSARNSGEHTETLLAALHRFNKCMSQTEESNQACVKHCYSWKQCLHPNASQV